MLKRVRMQTLGSEETRIGGIVTLDQVDRAVE